MHKRVRIALVVLLVVIGGVSAWQGLREREPVYKGKPLSVWLNAYRLHGLAGVETWQVRVEQQKADEAVRQAGTNALPTLLRMLQAKDSAFKVRLMNLAERQHFINIKYTPAKKPQRVCMKGVQRVGRWWVTKPRALARLSSPIAAWKSVSDWKWGFGWQARHSIKRLMTSRRTMPRIHSPLVLRTRHRSSLSDTSKRWWVPFSIP
jgi:hypothetical protein